MPQIDGAGSDDTLDGGTGDDVIFGLAGDDILWGGPGADALDGGEGNDTADYSRETAGMFANLSEHYVSNDSAISIENVVGTPYGDLIVGDDGVNALRGNDGNDTIDARGNGDLVFGNAGDDVLYGGAGDDILEGGPDDDILRGAEGSDTASYAGAEGAVQVSLLVTSGGQDTAGAGIDALELIENLTGSAFNDTLTGDAADNVLSGGAGDDVLNGGDGADTASYATAASEVTVNLSLSAAQNTGGAGTDTLAAIENLIGSAFDDILEGSTANNVISGGGGEDLLTGGGGNDTLSGGAGEDTLIGGAGNDTLAGGEGQDRVSYAGAGAGVTVNLALSTAQNTGGAGTDTLTDIEDLSGSDFNDTLSGNASANVISGGGGNDAVAGGPGDDVIEGGPGDDALDGGEGTDGVSYGRAAAGVSVSLAILTAQNTGEGQDTLSNFENLTGSAFDDTLAGNAGANVLFGGGGTDTVTYAAAGGGVSVSLALTSAQATGGAGSDTLLSIENLTGSAFADLLIGNAESNQLRGGGGDDVLMGGNNTFVTVDEAEEEPDLPVDVFDGGAGSDTVSFASGVSVWVFLGAGEGVHRIGSQYASFISIENLIGSPEADLLDGDDVANILEGGGGRDWLSGFGGADTLRGGDGGDELTGGDGDDVLQGDGGDDVLGGDAGADVMDGGLGVDLVRYRSSSAGVTVNLGLSGAQNTGGGGVDTLMSIENLDGSNLDDILTGNSAANRLFGGGGADTLVGGGGVDFLRGGPGTDTADYSATGHGVIANLTTTTSEDDEETVIYGFIDDDEVFEIENVIGTAFNDSLTGDLAANALTGGDGADTLRGAAGNDILTGGSNVDTAVFSGARSAYTITHTGGTFTISGPDGTDTLTTVEYAQFDDVRVQLRPGTGRLINFSTDDPDSYMSLIRDFDGNDVGAGDGWLRIGQVDLQGDGDLEQIFVNRTNGRWASVGPAEDGLVYFDDHGWAGDTRVVGIYIDPLVQSGEVVQGGPHDSQRRFQNDLFIENINGILGAGDYDHDGLQEVYFRLTDGTAYLHAYMHADGNIRYANYQNQQQVIDFLTANGWASSTWAGWFG